jgi:hypothetical protein
MSVQGMCAGQRARSRNQAPNGACHTMLP